MALTDVSTIAILKKEGHKFYTDSSLKSMKKEWLIEYIRTLEHNWATALERCENQAKLLEEKFEREKENESLSSM